MAKTGKGTGRGEGSPIRRGLLSEAPKNNVGWGIRNAASGAIVHSTQGAATHAGGGKAVGIDTQTVMRSAKTGEPTISGGAPMHYGGGEGTVLGQRQVAGPSDVVVIDVKRKGAAKPALQAAIDAVAAQADAARNILGTHIQDIGYISGTIVAGDVGRGQPAKTKADLVAAARAATEAGDEDRALRRAAVGLLGLDSAAADTEETLIEAIAEGFPATTIDALRSAGWPYEVMQEVIAPRRTLMRRKSAGHTLTPSESDAAWRLATILVAAERVFASRAAALAWLLRTKITLRGRSPAELLASSVGTAHIASVLRRIDAGDYL